MQSTSYLQLDQVPSKDTGLQGVAAATGMAQPPMRRRCGVPSTIAAQCWTGMEQPQTQTQTQTPTQ
jgi:hypothetical protein